MFQAHTLIFYIYMRHGLVKFDFRHAHSTLAGHRENRYVFLLVCRSGDFLSHVVLSYEICVWMSQVLNFKEWEYLSIKKE